MSKENIIRFLKNIAKIHIPVFTIPFLVEREANVIGFTIAFCFMGLGLFYFICIFGAAYTSGKENSKNLFYFFLDNMICGICLWILYGILIFGLG